MGSGVADNDESAKPRPSRKMPWWVSTIVVTVATVFLGLVIFGPGLSKLDQQWFTCEVSSVSPQRGNRNSLIGWGVKISTADCGTLSYSWQVDSKEDAEAIVSSFRPGEFYEFKLGALSRTALRGWVPADVWEYRPVE